jgi:Ferritin-like domain
VTDIERRDVLRAGGFALGFGALVAACSSDDDPAPEVEDDIGTTTVEPDGGSTDIALLNTALSLEVLVFDTLQVGADSFLATTPSVREVMALLQQHHAEHRESLRALVEAADAEPFMTANPVVKAALVDPGLVSVSSEQDFIRLVHDLEQACAQLYVHVATELTTIEPRSTVMSIAAVASRRATVLDLLGDLATQPVAVYATANPFPSDAIVPR